MCPEGRTPVHWASGGSWPLIRVCPATDFFELIFVNFRAFARKLTNISKKRAWLHEVIIIVNVNRAHPYKRSRAATALGSQGSNNNLPSLAHRRCTAVAARDRSSGCAPRLPFLLIFAHSRENWSNHFILSQIFVDFRANARKSTKISEKKSVSGHTPTSGHGPPEVCSSVGSWGCDWSPRLVCSTGPVPAGGGGGPGGAGPDPAARETPVAQWVVHRLCLPSHIHFLKHPDKVIPNSKIWSWAKHQILTSWVNCNSFFIYLVEVLPNIKIWR